MSALFALVGKRVGCVVIQLQEFDKDKEADHRNGDCCARHSRSLARIKSIIDGKIKFSLFGGRRWLGGGAGWGERQCHDGRKTLEQRRQFFLTRHRRMCFYCDMAKFIANGTIGPSQYVKDWDQFNATMNGDGSATVMAWGDKMRRMFHTKQLRPKHQFRVSTYTLSRLLLVLSRCFGYVLACLHFFPSSPALSGP
jgi:hypothetical protein